MSEEQRYVALSADEMTVLTGLADGAQSKEIAASMKRSRGTVEFYIRALFLKLEARSRPHLVAQAFRMGLLDQQHNGSTVNVTRQERGH